MPLGFIKDTAQIVLFFKFHSHNMTTLSPHLSTTLSAIANAQGQDPA